MLYNTRFPDFCEPSGRKLAEYLLLYSLFSRFFFHFLFLRAKEHQKKADDQKRAGNPYHAPASGFRKSSSDSGAKEKGQNDKKILARLQEKLPVSGSRVGT